MMDVAGRAGVSQTTVSLVLNDIAGARLSETTRNRVRKAADELGYRLVRRGPRRTSVDKTAIAFIVDEISTDPWMALAFDGVREKAWEFGLSVNLWVTRGDREMEEAAVAHAGRLPLLGIVYGSIFTRRVEPRAALLDRPSVLLNCYDAKRALPSVIPGDLVGGRTATERLIRSGHRRIGLINGQAGIDASRDRLRGYRQALASADLTFDPALVRPGNWEPSTGYEGARDLLALTDPPTAIFCANDPMAVGCFEALKELGLRIPRDISVIGFDDREIAQFTRPPLTTLVLPHYDMGATAAELLIDWATEGARAPQIKVDCPLVERKSVGPLARGRRGDADTGHRRDRKGRHKPDPGIARVASGGGNPRALPQSRARRGARA
jgi:LacI family transcriptional regulator